MKFITIIFLCLFWSLNSFAQLNCIDFSGTYRLNGKFAKDAIDLIIEQKNCKSIHLSYFEEGNLKGSEILLLNAQKVKLSEYPDIGLTIYGTPYFKGNDIVVDIENRWNDGKSDFFKRRYHLIFSSKTHKTHLLVQRGDFRNDGVFVPSTQNEYIRDWAASITKLRP